MTADRLWTPEELAAVPDAPPPIRWASVGRIAAGVAAGVIAAALVVVPGATWWDTTIAQPSVDGLAEQVASSMQNSLRGDDTYRQYGLTVPNVTFVRTGQNTYQGQATVRTLQGRSSQVSVSILWDGERMMWETPPGSMAWLVSS